MRILLAIVHFWNPSGGGRHQSLRPDPQPRIEALQQQLLSLRRLGSSQAYLHLADRACYPANTDLSNEITIRLVTDGEHHVIESLPTVFNHCFEHVITNPANGRMLGFEAQRVLADSLNEDFDFYGYLEDDLLIHDPCFFSKLNWFQQIMGSDCLLLPQRFEFSNEPNRVDRFYIDGPISQEELIKYVEPGPVRLIRYPGGQLAFEPPLNPHSGCFILSHGQLQHWVEQPWWQDGDDGFISPLESAATLGVAKSFNLFKPCLGNAGWFEIQHYGTNFHCLIGDSFNSAE